MFNSFFGNDFFELTLQVCTEEDVYVQRLGFALQNLLRLRQKTRFARLLPPADSRAFGARYSRFALVAYLSQTVLNRVFDKDYIESIDLYLSGMFLCAYLLEKDMRNDLHDLVSGWREQDLVYFAPLYNEYLQRETI